MQPYRLELTYSVEPLPTGPDRTVVPTVCLVVECFSRSGASTAPEKIPLVPLSRVQEAATTARAKLDEAEAFFGKIHPRDQSTLTSHVRHGLIPAAQELSRLLLPEPVAILILGAPRPIPIEFRVDPVLNAIPWGVLFVGRDFLSFQHATGRQVLARSHRFHAGLPSRQEKLRAAWVVDPFPVGKDGLLPAVVTRARAARKAYVNGAGHERIPLSQDGQSIGEKLGISRFSQILRDHDVVLVLGHHADVRSVKAGKAPAEGLQFWSGTGEVGASYLPGQLVADLKAPHVPPELLFWLTCESGLTTDWGADWPHDQRVHGFVDAAIRAGVPHYIGSSIRVPQLAAMDLVEAFFLALARGTSVGEALRRARVAARAGAQDPAGGGSLVGLAFCLFGRPAQGLLNAKGERIGGRVAHACTHDGPNGACGLLYLPEEPGSANGRCAVHTPPDAPIIPSAPCRNPFQLHPDGAARVSALDPGWGVGLRTQEDPIGDMVHLCVPCLTKARTNNQIITIAELLASPAPLPVTGAAG